MLCVLLTVCAVYESDRPTRGTEVYENFRGSAPGFGRGWYVCGHLSICAGIDGRPAVYGGGDCCVSIDQSGRERSSMRIDSSSQNAKSDSRFARRPHTKRDISGLKYCICTDSLRKIGQNRP